MIEVNEVALENANCPILVTLAGMVIEVSEEANRNALSPMPVTPPGITTVPAQLLPAVTTPLVIV